MSETIASSTDEAPKTTRVVDLPIEPITAQAFAPYGTLIEAAEDGKLFGPDEAQLPLGRGTPRFCIMNLHRRPMAFRTITRHLAVTQCLASVGGKPWVIAVAPPDAPDDAAGQPDISRLRAFSVAGDQAVMLATSAWHAGPFFEDETVGFSNLELSDTNEVDHHNCALDRCFDVTYRMVQPG